eukprot:TRINITY_DN515_c0_g2_i1.p1 TRINITY_DN515_c0_g2~~TRINITY_DN515_c0_g2_i1.p1  ORF type:complete len:1507 (+),score=595.03 TRINITY_DN515_c0_g2_i1:1023-5543(+)
MISQKGNASRASSSSNHVMQQGDGAEGTEGTSIDDAVAPIKGILANKKRLERERNDSIGLNARKPLRVHAITGKFDTTSVLLGKGNQTMKKKASEQSGFYRSRAASSAVKLKTVKKKNHDEEYKQVDILVLGINAGLEQFIHSFISDKEEEEPGEDLSGVHSKYVMMEDKRYLLNIIDGEKLGVEWENVYLEDNENSMFANNLRHNVDAFLLVFNTCDYDSIEMIQRLYDVLLTIRGPEAVTPIVLVGNRLDLLPNGQSRKVSLQTGHDLADVMHCEYFECHHMEKKYVQEVFREMLRTYLRDHKKRRRSLKYTSFEAKEIISRGEEDYLSKSQSSSLFGSDSSDDDDDDDDDDNDDLDGIETSSSSNTNGGDSERSRSDTDHTSTSFESAGSSPSSTNGGAFSTLILKQVPGANTPKVRAGTIPRLIERLTYHRYPDSSFNKVFLRTYHAFMESSELLDMLRERFNVPMKAGEDQFSYEQRLHTVRQRVITVLKQWMVHDPITFKDQTFLAKFEEFLETDLAAFQKDLPTALRMQLTYTNTHVHLTLTKAPNPILRGLNLDGSDPQDAVPSLLEVHSEEVARQLALIEADLFCRISPQELMNNNWKKHPEKCCNIQPLIDRFNQMAMWISTVIVTESDIKKRAAHIKNFIRIAEYCTEINNFSSAMQILGGLSGTAVHRLSKTWKLVNRTRYKSAFNTMRDLYSTAGRYKEYNKMLKSCQLPGVPYLGLVLSNLTIMHEANSLKRGGLINFESLEVVAGVISEVERFQSVQYDFEKVDVLYNYLMDVEFMQEEDAYLSSLAVEPRIEVGSGMSGAGRFLQKMGMMRGKSSDSTLGSTDDDDEEDGTGGFNDDDEDDKISELGHGYFNRCEAVLTMEVERLRNHIGTQMFEEMVEHLQFVLDKLPICIDDLRLPDTMEVIQSILDEIVEMNGALVLPHIDQTMTDSEVEELIRSANLERLRVMDRVIELITGFLEDEEEQPGVVAVQDSDNERLQQLTDCKFVVQPSTQQSLLFGSCLSLSGTLTLYLRSLLFVPPDPQSLEFYAFVEMMQKGFVVKMWSRDIVAATSYLAKSSRGKMSMGSAKRIVDRLSTVAAHRPMGIVFDTIQALDDTVAALRMDLKNVEGREGSQRLDSTIEKLKISATMIECLICKLELVEEYQLLSSEGRSRVIADERMMKNFLNSNPEPCPGDELSDDESSDEEQTVLVKPGQGESSSRSSKISRTPSRLRKTATKRDLHMGWKKSDLEIMIQDKLDEQEDYYVFGKGSFIRHLLQSSQASGVAKMRDGVEEKQEKVLAQEQEEEESNGQAEQDGERSAESSSSSSRSTTEEDNEQKKPQLLSVERLRIQKPDLMRGSSVTTLALKQTFKGMVVDDFNSILEEYLLVLDRTIAKQVIEDLDMFGYEIYMLRKEIANCVKFQKNQMLPLFMMIKSRAKKGGSAETGHMELYEQLVRSLNDMEELVEKNPCFSGLMRDVMGLRSMQIDVARLIAVDDVEEEEGEEEEEEE